VVILLKQVSANQYSCLAERKSLVIKSCSVEKVHFQVKVFVNLFVCVQSSTHNV
jgi:hypothetical protein